jgi:hypothetical protein
LLSIAIEIGRDVAASILAAWLYDRFVRPKASKPAKETKLNERVIAVGSVACVALLDRAANRKPDRGHMRPRNRSDSLLFGAWSRRVFAITALDDRLWAHNILVVL